MAMVVHMHNALNVSIAHVVGIIHGKCHSAHAQIASKWHLAMNLAAECAALSTSNFAKANLCTKREMHSIYIPTEVRE